MKNHVSIVLLIVSSCNSVRRLSRLTSAANSLQEVSYLVYQLSPGISRRRCPHTQLDVLCDPSGCKIGRCHNRFTAPSGPCEYQVDFCVQPNTRHDYTVPCGRVTRQAPKKSDGRGGGRDDSQPAADVARHLSKTDQDALHLFVDEWRADYYLSIPIRAS